MRNRDILISGASIAGPTLAFWLRHHGFNPTIVERAPAPRRGGQAVDVRGAARCVAERMGVMDAIRRARTAMRGMSFVDGDGNVLMSTTEETLTGGPTDSEDVEIMRDDLANILYEATRDDVEYRFGNAVARMVQDDDGVHVAFPDGEERTYDLVIGADGQHSTIRALAFGPEADFARPLGMYLAVFTTANFLGLDYWQTFHQGAAEMAGMMSARHNTEARAILGFGGPPLDIDYRDTDAQKRLLAERFAHLRWETPRILAAMRDAPDFYFDAMAQIHMDRWSDGRVALVGDAAYCASPLSGQGSSLAMVGAYVLAGELADAGGDYRTAFARYEEAMRPFVAQNQQLALDATQGPPQYASVERAANAITLKEYAAVAR